MKRRVFIASAMAIVASPVTEAFADFSDDIVAALRKQGYETIEVSRTLLGRTRILATAPWGRRELILNPRTGEILRDILTDAEGNVVPVGGVDTSGVSGDDHSGPGGGGGDNDEDKDDDGGDSGSDDDESDGHSGHGGGGDDDDDDNSGPG
jgi:hypothetical protein